MWHCMCRQCEERREVAIHAATKPECMDCRASLAMTLDPNTHNDGF